MFFEVPEIPNFGEKHKYLDHRITIRFPFFLPSLPENGHKIMAYRHA